MPKPSRTVPPDVPPVVVVAPPAPTKELPSGVPLSGQKRSRKRPLDSREYPAARDSQGKPGRDEIRRETARHVASRQSARTPERSGQPRSRKPAAGRSGKAGK